MVKSGCKIEIAKNDIPVFKIIKVKDEKHWIAPVQKSIHEFNKELVACEHLEIKKGMYYDSITVGFHAYLKNEFLDQVSAIIPKGAEYCLGKHEEIVANKMIILKCLNS